MSGRRVVSKNVLELGSDSAAEQAACLVLESFREFYDLTRLDDVSKLRTIREEFSLSTTELGNSRAVLAPDSSIVAAVYAGYPAVEQVRRQQGSLLHWYARVPSNDEQEFLKALRRLRTQVPPVPVNSYYLARFAVANGFRGTGLAALALNDFLQQQHVHDFSLHVRSDNAQAIRFYAKNGFEVYGCCDCNCLAMYRSL